MPSQPPSTSRRLKSVEIGNPVALVLREMLEQTDLTYRDITRLIKTKYGISRSVGAIGHVMLGRHGAKADAKAAYGVRSPKANAGPESIPLALLIFDTAASQLPRWKRDYFSKRLEQAWEELWRQRAAQVEAKGAALPSLRAYMGYFQSALTDLHKHATPTIGRGQNQPLHASG